MDPLRRASGVPLGGSWAGTYEAARDTVLSVSKVPPQGLLHLALGPYANAFAVFAPNAAEDDPPCGMVCGASRWAFDAAAIAAVGPGAEVVEVPVRARVAWCAEVAASGGRPPVACPMYAFHDRMVALRHAGTLLKTPADDSSLLPDASAWYGTAYSAVMAVRARTVRTMTVAFGALLAPDTMHVHVEEEVPVSSGALAAAAAKFYTGVRIKTRAAAPQWVPSLLGARLCAVRTVASVEDLIAWAGTGKPPAISLADAVSLFRDVAAASEASRRLATAHAAHVHDAGAGKTAVVHRVRLALECAGGASALWALSLPLGATYAGPTHADGAHVLTLQGAPPLVVRPCRGGGWTAATRVSLAAPDTTPMAQRNASGSVVEAALRGLLSTTGIGAGGGRVFWERVLASPSAEVRMAVAAAVAAGEEHEVRAFGVLRPLL